jgi:hypothetical protein
MMPFIVLDKLLHKAGAGLNELDLVNELRCTLAEIDNVIIKGFSCEQNLHFDDCSFGSPKPGKEFEDKVCDLCLKW